MKIDTSEIESDFEVDMSPMIDMVFLLLIFFIVASTIIDEKIEIQIPAAVYAKIPEDTTGRITLSLNENDEIYIEQVKVDDFEELEELMLPQLEADPNIRILIRSGKNVRYKVNQKLMESLAKVGATDLIYSAYEDK